MKAVAMVIVAVGLGICGGVTCAMLAGCGPALSPEQQADVGRHYDTLSGCLAEGRAAFRDGGVEAGHVAYDACKRDAGIVTGGSQ